MSMRIITGSTGTTHVTSNNDGEFNQGIFGDGLVVFDIGEGLSATLVDNNTITIGDGDLIMQGRHALIEPGTTETVNIDTGAIGVNRNDLIVAEYEMDMNTGHESITLQVVKGTETSGTAQDPDYTEGDIRTGDELVQMPLYRVKIEGISIAEIVPLFKAVGPLSSQVINAQVINKFDVLSTDWVSNTDTSTSGLPWIATIMTSAFSDDSAPSWEMISAINTSGIPTSTETESINAVGYALFTDTGVTLYATAKPTVNLKLYTKGV